MPSFDYSPPPNKKRKTITTYGSQNVVAHALRAVKNVVPATLLSPDPGAHLNGAAQPPPPPCNRKSIVQDRPMSVPRIITLIRSMALLRLGRNDRTTNAMIPQAAKEKLEHREKPTMTIPRHPYLRRGRDANTSSQQNRRTARHNLVRRTG